ncbi:MAG: M14 family zinc carboxypeptidase, partial [Longimicrobiales bacterium]
MRSVRFLNVIVYGSTLLAAAQLGAQELRTQSEASGFTVYTAYDSMMIYLREVRASSTDMRLGVYGESREGRELPYAIFSRPLVSQPWEAAALGRPVVSLHANVHGGERTLRESLLILIRELSTPGTEANALLDDLVILVAPQINPDGFEATPRSTRGNAWGIDMNRDWVKLEQPALTAYARNIIQRWRPHLFVDGHNGGSFPYNLNYQCPSHAELDQRITLLCDQEIFPTIDARLEAGGYQSFYYSQGTETRWNGGGSEARIGRNYGGFINSVSILFESPTTQELADGVAAGVLAFKAVLEYARDDADRLIETVNRARIETIEMGLSARGDIVVDMEYAPEDYTVEYQVPVGEDEDRRVITVESDSLMKRPIATKTRPRPYAYLLPRDAVDAVAMLQRQGITVEVLERPTTVEVTAYTLVDVTYEQAYNHAAAARVQLGEVQTLERDFPAGTFVVPTGQMLGRLVSHMLEPETADNVVYWNTMDAWLPKAALEATGNADAGRWGGGADDPRGGDRREG